MSYNDDSLWSDYCPDPLENNGKTCKFCGEAYLHWKCDKGLFRLYNTANERHFCKNKMDDNLSDNDKFGVNTDADKWGES